MNVRSGVAAARRAETDVIVIGPALRRPADLLHWAGTETATEWSGYMDGVVQSGRRAAAEILDTRPPP